jgi:hypothetical protein
MIDVNATVNLTLPAGHCVTILQALDELPHRLARPVVDVVRQQIADQHPTAFEQPQVLPPAPMLNGHDVRE